MIPCQEKYYLYRQYFNLDDKIRTGVDWKPRKLRLRYSESKE